MVYFFFQNVIWIGYLSRPYSWYISTENVNSFVHLNECSGTFSCGPGGTCHRLRRNSEIACGYLAAVNSITSPRLPHHRHRRQGSRFGCAGARWSPTCAWEQADDQLVGGWPTPLKNISQLGLLSPIYGTNIPTAVPNHQPARDVSLDCSSVVPSGLTLPSKSRWGGSNWAAHPTQSMNDGEEGLV